MIVLLNGICGFNSIFKFYNYIVIKLNISYFEQVIHRHYSLPHF